MKKHYFVSSLLLLCAAALLSGTPGYAQTAKSAPPPAACKLPTTVPTGSTRYEQLAWQFFVAANCNTGNPDLPFAWQTWPEQTCLASGGKDCANVTGAQRLHASVLASKGSDLPKLCQPMTTIDNISGLGPGYKGYEKFIPTNLTDNPLFCEEVHVNKTEADYIISPKGKGSAVHNLQTLAGQKAFIRDGNFISFPKESLEIKADWIPAASIQSGKTFDCKNPPADLIVQTIENNCYALVAMHISSKLEPKWVWATFEAQSTMTNPNGCDPELYSNCKDPWGSKNGSTGKGQKTEPSQALLDLMKAANIDPKFKNYRLVGAQSQYYSPQVLSNSFTEFNAQVRREHASCMTCHFYTLFTKDTTPILENPNFGPFPGYAGTGNPFPVPKGWYDQDFSWLLGIMPETKEGSALKRQENKVLPRVPG